MNQKQLNYWTPFAVERNGKLAWIAVFAKYDSYNDWLTVAIDGRSRTWYRRGAKFYETRKACIKGIAAESKVLG